MRHILSLLVVGAMLGGGLIYSRADAQTVASTPTGANTATTGAAATPAARDMIKEAMTERSLGKADAPVVLEEFFALTCTHCAYFHLKVLPQFKAEYIDTGKVRIVYHDFIFNEVGLKASMLSRCAPASGYEQLLTTLFEMQSAWLNPQGGEAVLRQVAGFAGLSPSDIDSCLASKPLTDWLLQTRVDAINNLDINSTPTFLVRGSLERIVGGKEIEDYRKVIDPLLAKLPTAAPSTPAQP